MNSCLKKSTLHFSTMKLTLILLIIGVSAVLCGTDGFEFPDCDMRGIVTSTTNAPRHNKNCDTSGSESHQCIDEVCECKVNVEGARCDTCRPSTFGISADNIKGCNECFCSGVTNDCYEGSFCYEPITELMLIPTFHESLQLHRLHSGEMISDGIEAGYIFPENEQDRTMYWNLPAIYYGNRVRSYGGYLRLAQRFVAPPGQTFTGPTELILRSNGIDLTMDIRPESLPNNVLNYSILLRESEWQVSSDHYREATRADFMTVLLNVTLIAVAAPWVDGIQAVYIKDIRIDQAVDCDSPERTETTQIEVCRCPEGYTGYSCEACYPGYYRIVANKSLSVFGACEICPCHKHAKSCEIGETGGVMCHCLPGYIGEYCEHTGSSYVDPEVSVTFIVEPEQQTVSPGEVAVLTCIVDYRDLSDEGDWLEAGGLSEESRINVEWIRSDDLPLPRHSNVSDGILTIPNAERNASGVYICRGSSNDGIEFIRVSSLLLVGFPPKIVMSPNNRTVDLGTTASIVCEATGDQPITIKWTALGRDLLPTEKDDGEGVLDFRGIAKENVGKYVCNATNAAGSVLAVAQVLFIPEECN